MSYAVKLLLLAVALGLPPLGVAWAQPVLGPGQDPAAGARVFEAKGCSKCHAIGGVGGTVGPDLAKVARPRAFQDLAAAIWNHLPRMTARMQELGIPRAKLDGREAADLVAYLYTLGYFDAPGRPEVGKRLFVEKRCATCHQTHGEGGAVGPSLDGLRVLSSPLYVAAAMWNHGPQMTEVMKAKGVERPTLTGAELRDLIGYLSPATAARSEGPVYVLPGRADQGRALFADKGCVQCHPITGTGVGPSLVDRGTRRSQLEFAATIWNKAPAMQAARKPEMGPPPTLTAPEMADLVAYLYAAGYFGGGGNVTRGWTVMAQKACLVCHAVYGERGKKASDLTRAKGLDSPGGVLASLWNHTTETAPAPGGGKSPWPTMRPQEMADLVALLQAIQRGR